MTKQAQMNRSPRRGILMGVVSGIGAAAMNFGVAFGSPVVEAAAAHGANPAWRMNAVWLPLMAAGAIPNLFYCAYLMRSKRTSANFSVNGTGRYWLFASVMAFFWFASTLMYGVASLKLGVLGPVYGWPFFMSLIVIVSSVIGILAGEWKHATKSAVGLQFAGVAVLITAVIMLSYTGRHL
jgi:L-rhamnose-H+ transport protein